MKGFPLVNMELVMLHSLCQTGLTFPITSTPFLKLLEPTSHSSLFESYQLTFNDYDVFNPEVPYS